MGVTQVTIAGITGKLGQLTAKHILASSEARIQGFCRDKSKLPSSLTSNPRLSVIEGSSTDFEALRRACHGSEVVVCTYLGDDSLMVDGQKLLIDAAVAEKVKRFVASDYSIDFTKLQLGQLPSKDAMIHVRNYLQNKPIQGVHIMIGCLTEVFAAYLGLIDVKSNTVKYWGTGDEVWEFTTYGTTAEYIAKVANDEKAVGILKFFADSISTNDVAKILEDHNGTKPTMIHQGTMEELRDATDAARAKGNVDWSVMPLFYIYFIQNGQTALGTPTDSARYPDVKPKTFSELVPTL